MFSKLRKDKSEKTTEPPKLRGMPALKQMRSSKREECLSMKTEPVLSRISELEKRNIAKGNEDVHPTTEELERHGSQHVVIIPNFKRSVSPDSGHYSHESRHANSVDRLSCSNGSNFVFYGEVTPVVVTEDIPEADEDLPGDPTNIKSYWRISNGDSGYKSKDDGIMESKSKKVKKIRKKTNGKPTATCGLHQIKQQRRESRENISQSMRALTPKERESIQCLEDVLKDHPDGDESFDEVFNSESSDHDFENEVDMIFIEAKKRVEEEVDETTDYGYASVNDISRKYSLDSLGSVGSIIDLVGNLMTSPSSQMPPIYSVVDMSKKKRDITRDNDAIETANNDVIVLQHPNKDSEVKFFYEEEIKDRHDFSDDVTVHPEDVITQLDDVINSFNVQTDEETENKEDGEDGRECQENERTKDKRSRQQKSRESVSDDEKEMKNRVRWRKGDQIDEENSGEKEETDCRNNGKKKKEKRHKTRGPATNDEKEKKRREGRKERDPEAENERRERKKKRKEERRRKRREISESTDAAKRREENIARHVDEISALTQTMIKATDNEEPVYAQVRKPKKDINGNLKLDDIELKETIPDPPLAFANPPTVKQIELDMENQQTASRTREREDSISKFHLTPTPNHSVQEDIVRATHKVPVQGPRCHVSDSAQCTNVIAVPYFSKFQKSSDRLHVSQAMLDYSSQNLSPVTPHGPKVVQVDPYRHTLKETNYKSTSPSEVCNETPKVDPDTQHGPKVLQVDPYRHTLKETNYNSTSPSKVCNDIPRVDPERFADSFKLQQNVYRHPVAARQNFRIGRPISLNLELVEEKNGSLLEEKKKVAFVKPYSSFREGKSNPTPGQKPRPFVIRTLKKPIQLY